MMLVQGTYMAAVPTVERGEGAMSIEAIAQKGKTVTGTVSDEMGPLVGASVVVKGSSNGTVTDIEGRFTLSDVPDNAVLQVSYIGYLTQEIVVGKKKQFAINLREDSKQLDEVVVVGFGTQKKVNLTGSVASVSSEKFENRPVANIGQALQGVIPNLNITISNGQPNTVPSFNIRGGTTISDGAVSNGAPLILVDGVDVSASLLNQMNPNDIESMTVIKDASAAAIYGTKATFGVILITTKSGKYNQKGKISYSYDISFDTPTALPDIMSSVGLLEAQQLVKQWTLQSVSQAEIDKLEAARRYMENPTEENRYFMNGGSVTWVMNMNPYEEAIRDWTPTQKHNLSVSGGGDKMTYYLSLGYQDQEGMYKIGNDVYNRYNIMARFSAKVNKWFNVEAKVSYNRTNYDAPSIGGAKGSLWTAAQREPDKNIMMPIKTLPTDPVPDAWTDNFLAWMSYGYRSESMSQTTVFAIMPEFIILPKILKAKAELSYQPQSSSSTSSNPYHEYIKPGSWTLLNETSEAINGNTGSLSKSAVDTYLINAYLDYSQSFGKHNISAIAGFSQDYVDYTSLSVSLKNLFSADILKPGAADDITLHTSSTGAQRRTSRAGFGRINYNYDNKYLFEVNGRYDGSSRFTPNERFVFFPSFSVGWRISEERFMAKTRGWLDNLKLRASWGKLGSQPDSYYPYQATMGSGQPGYIINGTYVSAVYAPALVSPTLTWEKAATTNFGVDLTTLNNRLNVSFDIYERKTTDILTTGTVAYPSVLGATAPLENSGAIKANGWELDVKWDDRIGEVRYGVALTLSDAVTKVISYPANPSKQYASLYDGKTVGEIWGYDLGGILQAEDLVLEGNKYIFYGPHTSSYTVYPGYAWYRDRNGDGFISTGSSTIDDSGDVHIIGNSTPRYKFGITLNAAWKGFDFNAFFQGVGKRDYWISSTNYWGSVGYGGSQWMWDRSWKPEQTDAAFPMYGAKPSTCDAYLIDASYLRLKQVVLGYTLPATLTRKVGIDKLRFNFSAYNLFTITDIPEMFDPDQMSDAYPQKKTLSMGVQVTF